MHSTRRTRSRRKANFQRPRLATARPVRLRSGTVINPLFSEEDVSSTSATNDEWKPYLNDEIAAENRKPSPPEACYKPAAKSKVTGDCVSILNGLKSLKGSIVCPKCNKRGTLAPFGRSRDGLVIAKCASVYCRRTTQGTPLRTALIAAKRAQGNESSSLATAALSSRAKPAASVKPPSATITVPRTE